MGRNTELMEVKTKTVAVLYFKCESGGKKKSTKVIYEEFSLRIFMKTISVLNYIRFFIL